MRTTRITRVPAVGEKRALSTRFLRCAAGVFSCLLLVLSAPILAQTANAQAANGPISVKDWPKEKSREQLTEVQRRIREMPRSATTADGFVEILAADVPGDSMGFRLPLLRFTSQFVQELEHAYGLQMPREQGRGLVVNALDGKTNDVRVIAKVVQRDGHILTRLWLPSPGYTNLEALRFEIAQAYFRAWVDRHRPEGSKSLADELPKWLAFGAFNARTEEGSDTAIRAMLELRLEKRLPEFPKCVLELKKITSLDDAILAGYVASWLRERRALAAVLSGLAGGKSWSTEELLVTLTGQQGVAEQRKAFEERLERQSRAVLSPGRATAWDLRNFQAQLMLEVVQVDAEGKPGKRELVDFRTAIKRVGSDEGPLRLAAQRKLRELPMYAVQRGPDMAALSEAYSEFLVRLSRGASAERLGPLLDAAEAKFKEIVEKGSKPAPKPKTAEDENGKNNNR